jgi:hypothetical protein
MKRLRKAQDSDFEGQISEDRLRELITREAKLLNLTFDQAVERAKKRTLPHTLIGDDLSLLIQLLPAYWNMPIEGRSLETVSQEFCDQLNHLLARTICERHLVLIRLGTRLTISFRGGTGYPEQATLNTRFGEIGLYIGLICDATKIKRRLFRLSVSSYKYSLTPIGSSDPLCRWEYLKQWPKEHDRWCRHHLQGDIPVSIADRNVSLNDLHLPTGYVTIEDIIRFCIVDLSVDPLSDNWHEILEASYRQFKQEPTDYLWVVDSFHAQAVDILNTTRDTISFTKITGGKKMAEPAPGKFIQIATSSIILADRLYTTIHALDEKGNVWEEFDPDTRNSTKGKWVRLSNDREWIVYCVSTSCPALAFRLFNRAER